MPVHGHTFHVVKILENSNLASSNVVSDVRVCAIHNNSFTDHYAVMLKVFLAKPASVLIIDSYTTVTSF